MKVKSRRIEMESKVGGYNYDSAAITPLFDSHTTAVRLRDDRSTTCVTTRVGAAAMTRSKQNRSA